MSRGCLGGLPDLRIIAALLIFYRLLVRRFFEFLLEIKNANVLSGRGALLGLVALQALLAPNAFLIRTGKECSRKDGERPVRPY